MKRREEKVHGLIFQLMELVLQKCCFSDQARLRAVCKRWLSIPPVQPIKQLPWLMAYDNRKWSRCKLFDLTYDRIYTVNISTIKEYYRENQPAYIHVCSSKFGWLLLFHFVPQSPSTAFLLYSLFTNRMIQLPNLKTFPQRVTAAFSADPTSAGCVFFVLQHSSHAIAMEASTCRLGDTTWTTHVFPGYFCAISNVIYSDGLFWCATRGGRLATFSVAQGIWNVLPSPALLLLPSHVQKGPYMVESNGNLLVVLISHEDESRLVFKLDRSQMAWISLEDVGDQTLFLDPTSLSVSAVSERLGVSGKIHYSWDYNYKFRSNSYPKCCGSLADECLCELWIEPPS